MVTLWGYCFSAWGCLTLCLWFPAWSTSWQTPACHICCLAGPFHPDLHHQTHQGKLSENQRLTVKSNVTLGSFRQTEKNNILNTRVRVPVYLNCLIYLVCSHGGRHGDSDGWWHSELSCSSSRLWLAVQWQRQKVRSSDWMDALGRERTGAAENGTKLPTWRTNKHKAEWLQHPVIQKSTHLTALCS